MYCDQYGEAIILQFATYYFEGAGQGSLRLLEHEILAAGK